MNSYNSEKYPQLRGELFKAVQRDGMFDDSKRFVDSVPTEQPEVIRRRFQDERDDPEFDLQVFVESHFSAPTKAVPKFERSDEWTMDEHIHQVWEYLTREPDDNATTRDSLIPLSHDYVVPGGRFRELYYWDSYFTAEGLAAAGRYDTVEALIQNFANLISEFGFVPNGNRLYYTSRSQVPLFCCMLQLLARERGTDAIVPYLPALEREYQFWMDGRDGLSVSSPTHRRTVRLDGGHVLNRYWDDNPAPREEAYAEDRSLAEQVPPDERNQLYRNVRAACESGWDFSSRWLADPDRFTTIRTTELVPIDLNAALYNVERALSNWFEEHGKREKADRYRAAAAERREAIDTYCWDRDAEFYFDYCWTDDERTDTLSLAAVAPLFFQACSDTQAVAIAHHLEKRFLKDGGLVMTLQETDEQWDKPNGWAPLQWMAVVGLRRYGHHELAQEIADRWLQLNRDVFRRTGKMMEKYNVVNTDLEAGGGEYPLQDGFGWTNGVALALQSLFDRPDEAAASTPLLVE